MRSIVTAILSLVLFPGFGAETVSFDSFRPGIMPPYWTAASTHGINSKWEIRRDPHAPTRQNVFSPVSAAADGEYPLAIYDRFICRDGEVSVKFKITGGRQAQKVGIVFRYQDPNNYYLLDLSADQGANQGKIGLVHVQDGQAHQIPAAQVKGARPGRSNVPDVAAVKHPISLNQWYVAKVSYQKDIFRVSFGNRLLFDAKDDAISVQGKTGLWTKGGTMAEFDDFRLNRRS